MLDHLHRPSEVRGNLDSVICRLSLAHKLISFQVYVGSSPLRNRARNSIPAFVSRPVSDPVWLIVALVKDPNVRQKGDTLTTQYRFAFFCNVLASWKQGVCRPRKGIRGGRPGLNTATRFGIFVCTSGSLFNRSYHHFHPQFHDSG